MRPALAAALAAHVVLAAGYVAAIPVFEAPDEPDHFRYAQVVATSGALPIHRHHAERLGRHHLDECGLAHHPPLYHAGLALALHGLDAADLVGSLALPHEAAPPDRRRSWKYGHGFDERWPWSREVWVLRLLRAISVALGAVTLVLIHRLGCVAFPARPAVADLAVLLVAALPAWSYAHGVLDNGNLATTLVHLALLIGASSLAAGTLTTRAALGLGLASALALSTKLTSLGLALPLGLMGVILSVRSPRPGRVALRLALAAAVVAAANAWFLLRNLELYGDLLGAEAHADVFHRSRVPEGTLLEWLTSGLPAELLRSASAPNLLAEPAPVSEVAVLGVVALAVLGGLAGAVRRRTAERGTGWPAVAYLALAAAGTAAVFLRFNLTYQQAQARYLLPAAGPAALLAAAGLVRLGGLLPPHVRRPAGALLAAGLVVGAAALLVGRVVPEVAVRTVPESTPAAAAVGVTGGPASPDRAGVRLLAPEDGAASRSAPVFRWEPPGDDPDGAYFLRIVNRDGRVLLDTLAHLGLTTLRREWAIPPSYWATLPDGEELRWFVRRAPDRRLGEETADQPASAARRIRR